MRILINKKIYQVYHDPLNNTLVCNHLDIPYCEIHKGNLLIILSNVICAAGLVRYFVSWK